MYSKIKWSNLVSQKVFKFGSKITKKNKKTWEFEWEVSFLRFIIQTGAFSPAAMSYSKGLKPPKQTTKKNKKVFGISWEHKPKCTVSIFWPVLKNLDW